MSQMKLKFKQQDFQDNAVMSVVDLFRGNLSAPSTFSISKIDLVDMAKDDIVGYSNNLNLSIDQIKENLHNVQDKNLLPLTDLNELRFNIEMETGTGKTFVYSKTILELNKRYDFKKFVIIVPSVAIREGVFKSIQTTRDYFKLQYNGIALSPFIYNSKRRQEVRDFALSNNLEVMIINIDAFKKDDTLFNQPDDKMAKSAKAFIQECNPIIIIDEPQTADNTKNSREAIESLNPLFELRYSATHRQKINTVYRLTPVDAYNMGIVKQICVVNNSLTDDYNKPYIKLLEVSNKNGITARLELDCKTASGVKRQVKTVKQNSDLEVITGRDIYQDYVISGIESAEGFESIEFTNTEFLSIGQAIGDIEESTKKREQIKRTIESHLDKERLYIKKGIKVLSLFFIDEVSKYRDYNSEDKKGLYANMFEEVYNQLIELPKYHEIKEFYTSDVSKIHDGYFSKDKKGNFKNTNESRQNEDDYNTYKIIMQDKEKLLSFDCPLRFIFSHSALKEGWDNPNVFQICTLIENKTEFTQRQKIGRGLRLCVNQDGERVDDKNLNILHVVAEESFSEFADKLQKEIEDETGIKFGVLDLEMFMNLDYINEDGENSKTSIADARGLIEHFRSKNYIENNGKIKDTLKNDLLNGKVDLPKKFERARERIVNQLQHASKKVDVVPAYSQVLVKQNNAIFEDDRFIDLWNRIKQKTIYRVNMSKDKLIEQCVKEISEMDKIGKAKISKETVKLNINKTGIDFTSQGIKFEEVNSQVLLPDLVKILSENCKLTRDTITQILLQSNRLEDFLNNPERFIEKITDIIKYVRTNKCIDGIEYTKQEGKNYSFMDMFSVEDNNEITAFLDKNAVKVENSIANYIVYDRSDTERDFAVQLDNDSEVKFFFKIPTKFKIQTPVGNYTPDWAVYVETDTEKKFYFVIETKGSPNKDDLRNREAIKIYCGEKHFKALNTEIKFDFTKDFNLVKKDNVN